jgi:hypothetical protein
MIIKKQIFLKALFLYGLLGINNLFANVEFGIAEHSGAAQCESDAKKIGVKTCVSYYRIGVTEKLQYNDFPKDFNVILSIKFPQEKLNIHSDIVQGKYDAELGKLVNQVKLANRKVTFRVMPEGNSWWSSDSAYYKNQTPQTYVDAFKYVVDYLKREIGPLVEGVDLNLNSASFDEFKKPLGVSDFKQFNPGPGYINHVSFSVYNRCGTSTNHKEIKSFSTVFRPSYYAALEAFKDVSIGIAEVATSPYCGIKVLNWYINLFLSLKGEFDKVDRVMFFFRNVPKGESSNDVETKWDEVLKNHSEAIRSLIIVGRTKKPSEHNSNRKIVAYKILGPNDEGWRFPWRFWANYNFYTKEAANPSIGPLSKEPFGEAESVFRMQARQSAMWGFNSDFSVGPSLSLTYVQSPNELMWWNNLSTIGASLNANLAIKINEKRLGSVSLEYFREKNLYTVDTPSHFKGEGSKIEGIRLGINIAGDWSK